uniref:Uncharacterized protein n=1 Tax=Balaenoptera musculus TaxID=9771 RepID=A0A8C0DH18_BALMU
MASDKNGVLGSAENHRGEKKGCTCSRTSVILNGVCHGVEYKFNYKNGDFIEILSLYLRITTKPWVGSLCVFSVTGALEGNSQRKPALQTVFPQLSGDPSGYSCVLPCSV